MKPADLLEAQFQAQVVDIATRYQWRSVHFPDSRRVTSKGWPDLALLKGDRLVVAELKTTKGRLSTDQRIVLGILHRAGIEVTVWRPGDIDDVLAVLGPARRRATLPPGLIV